LSPLARCWSCAGQRRRRLRRRASLLGWILLPSAPAADKEKGEEWTVVTTSDNLTTYSRPRKGSSLLEYKGVGLMDAEPIVIKRVIDDTAEYPKFMPYVAETKTISNDGKTRVGYQRLSPPIVGDRDYTVRVHCESKPCPTGGTTWLIYYRSREVILPTHTLNRTKHVALLRWNVGCAGSTRSCQPSPPQRTSNGWLDVRLSKGHVG
jgi:hypothetical protein